MSNIRTSFESARHEMEHVQNTRHRSSPTSKKRHHDAKAYYHHALLEDNARFRSMPYESDQLDDDCHMS